jgi:hypothetical protein
MRIPILLRGPLVALIALFGVGLQSVELNQLARRQRSSTSRECGPSTGEALMAPTFQHQIGAEI